MAEAQRLLRCMDNGFDSIENVFRPMDAPTFSLRSWAAARRLLQQREAEAQKVEVTEEASNDPWAPPEVTEAVANAAKPKEATPAKKPIVSTATLAAGGGLLAQFDDAVDPEEEVVRSHLRQESSAILASRRPPRLRRSRLEAIQIDRAAKKELADAVSRMTGDVSEDHSTGQVGRRVSFVAVDAFAGDGQGNADSPSVSQSAQSSATAPPASMLAALRAMNEKSGQPADVLPVDWHRRKSLANDDARRHSYVAGHSQSLERPPSATGVRRVASTFTASVNFVDDMPSINEDSPSRPGSASIARPVSSGGAAATAAASAGQPKKKRVLPRSTFRTHDDPRLVVTNRTGRLRGPMALMHPVRGVDRVNYEELYRDQYTAAREMLDRDDAYMATMETLDFHMASVKFTFNKMLEGKFMHDEAAKKAELGKRQRVLTREYRMAQSTGSDGASIDASASMLAEAGTGDGASTAPPEQGAGRPPSAGRPLSAGKSVRSGDASTNANPLMRLAQSSPMLRR